MPKQNKDNIIKIDTTEVLNLYLNKDRIENNDIDYNKPIAIITNITSDDNKGDFSLTVDADIQNNTKKIDIDKAEIINIIRDSGLELPLTLTISDN